MKLYRDRYNGFGPAFAAAADSTRTEGATGAGIPQPRELRKQYSHFGKACDKLGVVVIAVNRPQCDISIGR